MNTKLFLTLRSSIQKIRYRHGEGIASIKAAYEAEGKKRSLSCFCIFVCMMFFTSTLYAQNTGGVFGPAVKADDRSAQYRITLDPDGYRLAQRVHYQHSINDDFRPRLVVQGSSGSGDNFVLDFLQTELMWDLIEGEVWHTALRLDGQLRFKDGRGLIGLNWANQFNFGQGWSARFLILSSIDVGNETRSGLFLQTRANVTKKIGWGLSGGVEIFNFYGTTADFVGFDDQTHQVGPSLSVSLGGGWSLFGSALFGLSTASPDQQYRFWVTKGF